MVRGNGINHPKVYVCWSDWEAWLLKEWTPFRQNDLPHLKRDITWLKGLTIGILFAIIAGAIAIIIAGH